MNLEPEIISDGRTVWVNGIKGECLGRFSWAGVDVHKDFEGQMTTGKQCLNCISGPTTLKEWDVFKTSMKNIYGVAVSDEHKPKFLLEKGTNDKPAAR